MKWIKLFEDFNGDVLEDAKDILRLQLGELEEINFIGGDLQVEMSDSLKDRIRVYKLLESPNVRDLTAFEEHFNEEEIEGVFYNVNLDWYNGQVAIIGIGESIEEFLGEWLRERFSGLKKFVESESTPPTGTSLEKVFYREENGTAVFYYYEHVSVEYVYVSFQSIWGFFRTVLCLEERQIRTIVHDWILKEFNLDLEPKMW
jgi:hypothetical protein